MADIPVREVQLSVSCFPGALSTLPGAGWSRRGETKRWTGSACQLDVQQVRVCRGNVYPGRGEGTRRGDFTEKLEAAQEEGRQIRLWDRVGFRASPL